MIGPSVVVASRSVPEIRAGLRTAVFYAALAALAAGLGIVASLSWVIVAVAGAACAVTALAYLTRAQAALARRRRAANALLRTGVKAHRDSALLSWRAHEVTSEHNRAVLAGSLRSLIREIEKPAFTSPVPLHRRAVRPHVAALAQLADRISQLELPVGARAMVLVEDLLTDGHSSPLYIGGKNDDVATGVARCLTALDQDLVHPGGGLR